MQYNNYTIRSLKATTLDEIDENLDDEIDGDDDFVRT